MRQTRSARDYDPAVIVRPAGEQLWLITQPDHAVLAAEILERWGMDAVGDWRSILLYATRQHDNGWLESDPRPTVLADGRPADFVTAPESIRQAMWPRAAARLGMCDPIAGALIAQHALTIYARFGSEPGWSSFFERLTTARDRWLAAAGARTGAPRRSFDRAYDLLRLADLASLVFCNGWRESHDEREHRFILSGDTLMIAPDPFLGRTVDLRVQARVIPDRPYQADDDLRRALRGAPLRWLTGRAVGG